MKFNCSLNISRNSWLKNLPRKIAAYPSRAKYSSLLPILHLLERAAQDQWTKHLLFWVIYTLILSGPYANNFLLGCLRTTCNIKVQGKYQQIHIAKQKHAFIQHYFDKRWLEMHSILLSRNDKTFQLPALLYFSTQCINISFQKHQIIGLKLYATNMLCP